MASSSRVTGNPYKEEILFPGHEEFDFSLWNKSFNEIWPEFGDNATNPEYPEKYNSQEVTYLDVGYPGYADGDYFKSDESLPTSYEHRTDFGGSIRCL